MGEPGGHGGAVPILAPVGRDAPALAGLVARAGLRPIACTGLGELVDTLAGGADVAVIAEEGLYGVDLEPLDRWVAQQAPWSDQPFIVLTNQSEGAAFFAFRRRLVERLRNVAFLERPLQAITLQAAVRAAQRSRERQYEARSYLETQQDAAAHLETVVAMRTRELEMANRRLVEEIQTRERTQAALLQAQKIEALGHLVGGVAHDFNNLLMAVIGNLDLLAKRFESDPRARRLLDSAMEGARRGATLTQRLLAFARRQDLQARVVDLRGLVEGMKGLIEQSVGPRIRIEMTLGAETPVVSIDANQLEMALLNLALNARDAMPNGGVLSFGVALDEAGPGSPAGVANGRYAVLTVRDNGEGMDAETLAKAVDPFFSTKVVGKGTGLGLSMVHGLAEQSGGALDLASAPGQGTTVRLWLPAAFGVTAPPTQPERPISQAAPAKILLVDDDALIAISTAALLEDLGHTIIEANSAAEALRLLDAGLGPDLLITDHAMPGMTGMELAIAVRGKWPSLPILLATGFADLDGGAAIDLPRLSKPYTQGELAIQIGKLLGAPAR